MNTASETTDSLQTGVVDTLGRPLRSLRISVTDRCNLRCIYCMPKEVFGRGYNFLPKEQILAFEEIDRLARVFTTQGVEKIRLTGGEPLLRRDLERLVAMLRKNEGLREVTLTTNGSLLAQKAEVLRQAGLTRLTVSLDALDDATYRKMNDVDFPVNRVLEGIDAALKAGFAPIRLNTVVKRGVNEHSIEAMARRFHGPEFILRFIEFMDVGNSNGWRMSEVVQASEIVERFNAVSPIEALPRRDPSDTALRFRTASGGEIGIVASVTQPFCGACSRARITADGRLYTCLFSANGYDLRELMRSGASDAELVERVRGIWSVRGDRYSEIRTEESAKRRKVEMSLVGG